MDEPSPTPPTAGTAIDVAHVARLARLALSPDELARMHSDLTRILGYVDELRALDTADVPAMSHPLPFSSPYRPDEAGAALPRDTALAGAPANDGEAFIVPRVV